MSGGSVRRRRRSLGRKLLPAGLVVALLGAAPQLARACAVCTAGRDEESQWAFIITTVFLSVLPLALIGGIAWMIWRRLRDADAREADAPPALPDPSASR